MRCLRFCAAADGQRLNVVSDSFGSSSAHFGLQDEWAAMIDPPPLMEVLEAIFGTKDFCSTGAGGGDYNSECKQATVALPAIYSTRSSASKQRLPTAHLLVRGRLTQPLLPTGLRPRHGAAASVALRLQPEHRRHCRDPARRVQAQAHRNEGGDHGSVL